jgi:magnesium transporter
MYDVRCTMHRVGAYNVLAFVNSTHRTSNIVHRVHNTTSMIRFNLGKKLLAQRKKPSRSKAGLEPETHIYTGSVDVPQPNVTVVSYNDTHFHEEILRGGDCLPVKPDRVLWYDVRGLTDVALIQHIGQSFNMHPLALEDVLNIHQRPKWDDYEEGIFITVRALRYDAKGEGDVVPEQVSFFLANNVLLSFQEDVADLFLSVRERLHKSHGKIRQKTADYLLYVLLDCIVDDYILLLEKTEDEIDKLETQIINNYHPSVRSSIYQLKRHLNDIRRAVLPLRDVVSRFSREDSDVVNPSNQVYIRDLYDHVVRVVETVENQRDMLTNLHDLYNAEQSNRTNHVMRVLTVVSAIFIPLTFIVGVYGTNFDVLPELHYPHAYGIMWAVMILIAVFQLIYFRWRRWL